MILPHCRSAQISLRGRRSVNQDATAAVHLPDGRQLIAVADGMGGHRGGEVASAIAIQVLTEELRRGAGLAEAVQAANAEVFREAARNPAVSGMGTTLVALVREGLAYQIANVGDSRAYRVERDTIVQITRDHSFAAEAVDQRVMSSAEVSRSPWRNALTRSLGVEATVSIDLFGPFEVSGPPHVVILCSDGLYRAVRDATLREVLLHAEDADHAAEALSRLAVKNRSEDNISVALLECGEWFGRARSLVGTEEAVARGGMDGAAGVHLVPPLSPARRQPGMRAQPRVELVVPPGRSRRRTRRRGRRSVRRSDSVMFGLSVVLFLAWMVAHLLG